tara:strand:+ start:1044 stop:1211 length:168 start_codon:yes stop_codon:yes gene_type:complete
MIVKYKKKFNVLNLFKRLEDSNFENETSRSEKLFLDDKDRLNREKMRLVRSCKSF